MVQRLRSERGGVAAVSLSLLAGDHAAFTVSLFGPRSLRAREGRIQGGFDRRADHRLRWCELTIAITDVNLAAFPANRQVHVRSVSCVLVSSYECELCLSSRPL
jgi:hypothetical protein